MSAAKTAVVALGSNLEAPQQQVAAAVAAIAMLPEVAVSAVSSLYRTKPVGYADQPDFVNAVLLLQTTLPPPALLRALQAIENRFGRVRHFRNAPRTLDLDIIDYAGLCSHCTELELPHPRAHLRQFVMAPLAEIAPDYVLPGQRDSAAAMAAALRQAAPQDDVVVLAPPPTWI